MKKTIKIDDVAKAAGVSKATVSRVMNNPGIVTGPTADKVKRAMERLDYTPNAVAQSMRSQRTRTIGVVIPDLNNSFYSAMLGEIENAAKPYNYMLTICPTSGVFAEEKAYMERMVQRRVDGILHFTYNNSRAHIEKILSITEQLPFILMDETKEPVGVNQVVTDGFAGMADAVDYFAARGHTRIGCIRGVTEAGQNRLMGYLEGMKRNGLPVQDDYLFTSGFSIDEAAEAAKGLVRMKDRPTALLCITDSMAVGFIKELTASGVRIPQDIQIIGFNNSELSTVVTPALSTIGQNRKALGERAVKLMMDMINTPHAGRKTTVVKVKADLILRDTTT